MAARGARKAPVASLTSSLLPKPAFTAFTRILSARSSSAATPVTPPPATLVARREGTGPRVLIVGHLDTVHDPHGSFQTLTASTDGRTVVGPGAVDMKGGLVIAMTALEALAEADTQPSWTVLLNSDEETGSFCSDAILPDEARRHDLGIVLGPALPGGGLALERGGSGQFMVEVFGRAAHAGREFTKGISAVVKLAAVIQALHELVASDDGVIVNIGPLKGGRVTNTVADHAAGWGNVRYPDAARGEAYRRRAVEAVASLSGDPFLARNNPRWEGVLMHGVYHRNKGLGVGESVMWGDFFFVEVLTELLTAAKAAP